MSCLIISERGFFLGKLNIVRKGVPNVLIPARKVEQILIMGSGISVSSDAIELADEIGVEIVFANYYGKPLSRLIPAKLGGTVKTRRAQYKAYDERRGTDLARSWHLASYVTGQKVYQRWLHKNRS